MPPELRCEMTDTCAKPVTMIDDKGYVYCTGHGRARRCARDCRELKPYELDMLRAGEAIRWGD